MKQRFATALCHVMICIPLFAQESTSEDSKDSRQTVRSFDVKLPLNYLQYLPADYKPSSATDKKWPLLVFLHGAGERGSNINTVKRYGPPRRVASGDDFPFVIISPQCPRGSFWNIDHLLQLIRNVIEEENIDPDRVYLTGLSMGGFGSWALAAEAPELFAAVAPVCGGGDPRTAAALVDVPIWAFHGDADRVVPASASQKMVDAIKDAGGKKIEFTLYEGVDHNSWTETYANEELYRWLLKHQREDK
ncbi:MAG: prolyl oligopeptidase family serine peptidase [Planctomycetota bacterium]